MHKLGSSHPRRGGHESSEEAVWGLFPQDASVPCPNFIFGSLHGFGYANVKVLRTNLCIMPVSTPSTSDMKFLLKQRGQWEQKHRNRVCPRQIWSVTGLRLASRSWSGDFPGGPGVGTPNLVPPLVIRELRSCRPCSQN